MPKPSTVSKHVFYFQSAAREETDEQGQHAALLTKKDEPTLSGMEGMHFYMRYAQFEGV